MHFIFRLAFLFMALVCASAIGTNTILANLISIASTAVLGFRYTLHAIACATEFVKKWIPANTPEVPFFISKKGLIICLVSGALITVIIIRLRNKYAGIDLYGRIMIKVQETLSINRKKRQKEQSKPLSLGLTISQTSSSAPGDTESIIELPDTVGSVASLNPQDCNTYKLVRGTNSQALKGILVHDSLPEQLDESLITANPKTDTLLRFDDFKLPGREKGGRTGIRRNLRGKVSTCSEYPADEKTKAILAESFTRSVKTGNTVEMWWKQDLNTVVDNEQLEFFTIEGLKTFLKTNKMATATSFKDSDQYPSMLHLSQCVSYLSGASQFVERHQDLLKKFQTVVRHAEKMARISGVSMKKSSLGLQGIRLKLESFMRSEIISNQRAYWEYDKLHLSDMEGTGLKARGKRLKHGHKLRKLVRHIWTQANRAQDRGDELLTQFADLMIDYYKVVREFKGLNVDEAACLAARSVCNNTN